MHIDPILLIRPAALFIATVLGALVLRKVFFKLVRRWSERTGSQLGDLLYGTLSGPTILWAIILAFHISSIGAGIPPRYLSRVLMAIEVLWIWSITAALGRFAGRAVRHYGASAKGVKSVTSLTEKLVQIAVFAIGIAWVSRVVFKTEFTALWGTLGVGGLAVALALQDTLSNLFAGFYVSISGLVNLGDYIRLNSGEEGYVSDITWRCTTMRTSANNLVVVPNNKLAQAIYTNYYLPEPRMGVSTIFHVSMNSDIARVSAILLDEITGAVAQTAGALADPPPSVRFNGPTENGLAMQVNCSVSRFSDQFLALSDLRTLLFTRLQRENVRFEVPPKAVILVPPPES